MSAAVASAARLVGVDRLRGLVTVLMALDHARHFLQPAEADPEDLATTTPLYFLSRWVTHLCAPTFVLLAGAALDLGQRPAGPWPDRRALKRGLWLIFIELTYVSFCWQFGFSRMHAGVLWAIGGGMVLMSLLPLPRMGLFAAGLGLPVLWSILPWTHPIGPAGALLWAWTGDVGPIEIGVSYAILPWFGVLCLGRALSPALRAPDRALGIGAASLALFAALRVVGFGDHAPLDPALDGWQAAADLLNPSKYPPSLQFQALFLGLALLLIAPLRALPARLGAPLEVLGRVPLFFYFVHLPIYNVLGRIFSTWQYGQALVPPEGAPALPLMALSWILGLLLVYPTCVVWAAHKARHPGAWWGAYI
jgi:uncharacterized membrane protein